MASAVAAVAAGALVVSIASPTSGSEPVPDVFVRGDLVDPDTFSMRGLHDETDLRRVDDAHAAAMDLCVADHEAIGGDEIHTEVIEIPGAKIAEGGFPVSASWTPDTCFWQSFESRGTEPFRYHGLGLLVQALINEADEAAISDGRFESVAGEWEACSGRDAFSLIRALSPSEADPLPALPACRETVDDDGLRRLIGEHHSRLAAENQPLLDEYVDVVDRAIDAVDS